MIRAGIVLCALIVSCSHSQPGITCGTARCAQGQVCCIDCDGRGTCGPPGFACTGTACAADGGAGDSGVISCGGSTCAAGTPCCLDCAGRGACVQPGGACTDRACAGDCGKEGAPCCPRTDARGDVGTGNCGQNLMCCEGEPYPEGGVCHESCPLRSDRNLKEAFESIDQENVLQRLAAIPVASWRYKTEPAEVRHVGPMAQDFRAAFGLGDSDVRIAAVDANGVAVAALQALYRQVQSLREESATLQRELAHLRARMTAAGVCGQDP